ncbi:agamous-like MADS-box protein AGL81 [Chenopodium quinoa]|uniref:MADS-box domain-containing protein n=1 Tax=Chenopodium quinoa TaxID=63459 RepID=A0A803L0E1_CHEQI|nr:agamous-like MADS-box protein AGL81 [Chenopodium quinoa]
MGRAKSSNSFIEKKSKRSSCFRLKKQTLFKKARELSILCDVPTCVIVFPPKEDNAKSVEPEVISYYGEEQHQETQNATNSELTHTKINRYIACPKDDSYKKRSSNLSDVLGDVNEEKNLIRADDQDLKYNIWSENTNLSDFTQDQLIQLLGNLDNKLDSVTRRMDVIKGVEIDQQKNPLLLDDIFSQSDYDGLLEELLEPYVEDHTRFYNMDQRSGFVDNSLLQSLPMMGSNSSYYDVDQPSGFIDNCPLQSLLMMGDQGPRFTDGVPLQCGFPTMGPTYCNQEESGFVDNQSFPMMDRPMYCDQVSGFVDDNLLAVQSYSNDNGYLMMSDISTSAAQLN